MTVALIFLGFFVLSSVASVLVVAATMRSSQLSCYEGWDEVYPVPVVADPIVADLSMRRASETI